ncbi:YigZ family protein [Croceitalea sp. MTPC9]|uniref:IMPACT family protein n=1 Tax=unclassified Croceitalea TaxID=2632280 RepID=UPI002B3967E6|nr:YigZ family protein [Croceitalea sp. MTPC6]GMN15474.1 YigZ family protein [Croceitalea sp. MTPC9]
MKIDSYKTVLEASEGILHKDKKSKFFGYVFPINSEEEVKPLIEYLKKEHHTAGHVCYAWQLGTDKVSYRANDDGEPNNSAGMPIYGQIQAFKATNVLVAVARIYGGTKLGVGGLIQAYKTTAQLALDSATIVEKLIEMRFKITFEYSEMDIVMRTIKQLNINIISQHLEKDCEIIISKRRSESETIWNRFKEIHKVFIKRID